MTHLSKWAVIERDGEELEINVEFDATPIVPAQLYGLPENCYPAEGGEVEITAVFLDGVAIDPPLTDAEEAKVLADIESNMSEDDWPDGPEEREY
jgi:hypothetical protein